MNSLPPFDFVERFSSTGPSASVMLAGCVALPKSVTVSHDARTASGVSSRPSLKVRPCARSQRSLPKKPPPTSKRPPVSLQSWCASQPTSGVTYSGFRFSSTSFGRMVSVRRDAAMGAMVLTRTFFFSPSTASVFAKPTRPSLAAE